MPPTPRNKPQVGAGVPNRRGLRVRFITAAALVSKLEQAQNAVYAERPVFPPDQNPGEVVAWLAALPEKWFLP
jgi:hypothetical protein